MHITILALGSTGDILPYTALGKGLKDNGYQVRFITFEGFKPTVEKLGLDFHPIPGDPRFLVAMGGTNIFSMALSFSSLAREYVSALSAPHLRETDLIINQLPGGLFGVDLAEKVGVPMVLAAVIPLAPTTEFPMMGFPVVPIPGYNKITYSLADMAAWMMFKKVINQWREKTLGLPAISRKAYYGKGGNSQRLALYGFSPTVVERPGDWGENIHVTGYWFPEDPDWNPPSDLEEFIEGGSSPIFIGFGSMPVGNPHVTTEIILEALKQTNQRAVLHMGWSGLGQAKLPKSVYRIEYAPYGWLFPKMGMVIHHGGSGTTGFALRAGVPSCAVPLGFDQIAWGNRVAYLGAGPKPLRLQALSASRLAEVIQEGISDESVRLNAAAVGQKIRAEKGIQKAIQIIIQQGWK